MENFHIKREEPGHFETNDESVNWAQANHPLTDFYKMEQIYVKENISDCSSAYFQMFDSKDEYGTQASSISMERASLCKTEEFHIDVKKEQDASSSAQFELDNEYGTQVSRPFIEGASLCKMEQSDIDFKDKPDISSAQFQQFELNNEYGSRLASIESAPLYKMEELYIDVKELSNCSITQFQEYARSVSSQEIEGNCYSCCASCVDIYKKMSI